MGTFKARPTMYGGHRMRSRLEAGFAAWLDQWGIKWEYEPEAYAAAGLGQYLPDFRLINLRTNFRRVDALVEVKPDSFWEGGSEADPFRYLDRCSQILSDNGIDELLVVSPKGVSVMEWDDAAGMYWPTACLWSLVFDPVRPATEKGEICVVHQLADFAKPWHGEWWKGTV